MTIQEYLRALRKELRRRNVAAHDLVREVADHLAEAYDRELASGSSPRKAESTATSGFGPLNAVADRLAAEAELGGKGLPGSSVHLAARVASSDRRRRPRAPGMTFAVMSLVLLIFVAALALTSNDPPPPTIAEFAPQAVEHITDAPDDQADRAGTMRNLVDGGESGSPAAQREATAIDLPRARRCVGDPPRQIEDPQSPPCVPYWDGYNGGSTWKGVTRDEVRIVVPVSPPGDNRNRYVKLLEAFFNRRFEFYGRKLILIPAPGGLGGADAENAAAVRADEEFKAFASTELQGGGDVYYEALARRRLVSQNQRPGFPESHLRRLDPYQWSYPMAADEILANVGEWVCARLAQRPAAHSRDVLLGGRPRVFGGILETEQAFDGNVPMSLEPVERELKGCGERLVVSFRSNRQWLNAELMTNEVVRMHERGVTSIVCACHVLGLGNRQRIASGQSYSPEWLVSTYLLADTPWLLRKFGSREQLESTFGVTFQPRQIRPEDEPSTSAVVEVDPRFRKEDGNPEGNYDFYNDMYRGLLLLASGIQMAGPHLTPETFGRALQRTRFPNPAHPLMAGSVGFAGGSHSMTKDAAEFWWSNTARDPSSFSEGGAICYVDGGRRHAKGSWPEGPDRSFEGLCDSGR